MVTPGIRYNVDTQKMFRLRRIKGVSQKKLAEECGIGEQTAFRLENYPNSKFGLDTIESVANFYGIDAFDIIVFPKVEKSKEHMRISDLSARTIAQNMLIQARIDITNFIESPCSYRNAAYRNMCDSVAFIESAWFESICELAGIDYDTAYGRLKSDYADTLKYLILEGRHNVC